MAAVCALVQHKTTSGGAGQGLACGSPCLVWSGVSQGDFLGEAAPLAPVGEKEYLGLGDRTEGCTRTRQSSACTDGPWGG